MSELESHQSVAPERFIAGGEALGHDKDGKVIFVRGGIPGDRVDVRLIESKGDWSRGIVDKVEVASSLRVEPPCFRRLQGCGGCDWQHIEAGSQLPAKVEIVRDALRRTARLFDPDLSMGTTVDHRGYRTSIRVVGNSAGQASYRMDRSNETVHASGCLIAHPSLLGLLERVSITPGLDVTLRTSVASGEITAAWDQNSGEVTGLPDHVAVGGSAFLTESVAGHQFRVSADSFFQSGPAAAGLLVDAVKRAAPELNTAKSVVDAYSGVGLFAVAATPPSSSLITIEASRSAITDCRINLEDRTARFEQTKVERWSTRSSFDVVIADPSRSGLGRGGVNSLAAADAPIFVLVSCDPVAMARDTTLLSAAGYRHDGTEVLDLFPHTHHVECVTRFVRV